MEKGRGPAMFTPPPPPNHLRDTVIEISERASLYTVQEFQLTYKEKIEQYDIANTFKKKKLKNKK